MVCFWLSKLAQSLQQLMNVYRWWNFSSFFKGGGCSRLCSWMVSNVSVISESLLARNILHPQGTTSRSKDHRLSWLSPLTHMGQRFLQSHADLFYIRLGLCSGFRVCLLALVIGSKQACLHRQCLWQEWQITMENLSSFSTIFRQEKKSSSVLYCFLLMLHNTEQPSCRKTGYAPAFD